MNISARREEVREMSGKLLACLSMKQAGSLLGSVSVCRLSLRARTSLSRSERRRSVKM